jgi:aryl-alcohol dehydrogenase-like predicted oxidoreductase
MEYSVWFREPEAAMLPTCRELGVSLVAYSPLGRGFLAGNFRSLADLPKDDARRNQPRFADGNVEHNLAIANAVRDLAQRKGATPAQIALAWVMAQGEEVLPIPGTKRRERQAENAASVDIKLTAAELQELVLAVDKVTVKGDRYPPAMMNALNG